MKPDLAQVSTEMAALARYVRSRADRRLRGHFQSIEVAFGDGSPKSFKVTGYRAFGGAHMGLGKTLDAAIDDMLARIERMPDIESILGLGSTP